MSRQPAVLQRGAAGYERRRREHVWQSIVPARFPEAIVTVCEQEDAVVALATARDAGGRVTVLSSGHSYIADALQDGTVLLDCTPLGHIDVDLSRNTARVGPAVTNAQLDSALAAVGRAFPVGHSPSVAVGGYLLGGGIGWNPDGWGTTACEHVLGATVLLASGGIVNVSAHDHPDLFWALRGAGPCFPGIVLEYEVRLLPRPRSILELRAARHLDGSDALLRWAYDAMRSKAPSIELAVMLLVDSQRDGPSIVVTATAFADSPSDAKHLLEPLEQSLPSSERGSAILRPRTLPEMMSENDAPPQRYSVDGVWSDDPIGVLRLCCERFRTCPSPDSLIHVSLRSHPALPSNAAFSRAASTFVFSSAVWDDSANDRANLAWQDALQNDLEPLSRGRYINETDYIGHPSRLRQCFAADAWARMEKIQAVYDPQGLFVTPNRT